MSPSVEVGLSFNTWPPYPAFISHKDTQAKAPRAASIEWILQPYSHGNLLCEHLLANQTVRMPPWANLFGCLLLSWVNPTLEDVSHYFPLGCSGPLLLFFEHTREASTPGPLYLSVSLATSSLPRAIYLLHHLFSQIFLQMSPSERVPSLPPLAPQFGFIFYSWICLLSLSLSLREEGVLSFWFPAVSSLPNLCLTCRMH